MISAIIPARNEEATITRVVRSLALQPEVSEIVVVDDQSTDRTLATLADLSVIVPNLKIISAGELPLGWTGKNHAVWAGARIAAGDWLLFTDADTFHLPGSANRALADASLHNATLVSYSPEQEMHTPWEKTLIPFVYWRLSHRYSFDRINDLRFPDAAANGQYILMRKDAYESIGGHASIAGEVLEDVALARRAKAAGHRIFFGSGAGIVGTRMYRSFGAMWEGWTKNLCPLFGCSLGEMLLEIDMATPWLGFVFAALMAIEWAISASFDWLLAIIAGIFLFRPWLWYAAWLRRNRYPVGYIRYYLIGSVLYTAALLSSWWKTTHSSVVWKGRQYARQVKSMGMP